MNDMNGLETSYINCYLSTVITRHHRLARKILTSLEKTKPQAGANLGEGVADVRPTPKICKASVVFRDLTL